MLVVLLRRLAFKTSHHFLNRSLELHIVNSIIISEDQETKCKELRNRNNERESKKNIYYFRLTLV